MEVVHLTWILTILSLLGNVFVIKKNVAGQWLWVVSNIGWVTYDLSIGAHAQACLFLAYVGMSIWGVIVWTKEKKAIAAAAEA